MVQLLLRSRIRLEPRWGATLYLALVVPADFLMSRQMLHGVKRRAERTTLEEVAALVTARAR
ncbi:MAG: hypothetical protein ACTHOD_03515 [Motilibacteraceae bacterium]